MVKEQRQQEKSSLLIKSSATNNCGSISLLLVACIEEFIEAKSAISDHFILHQGDITGRRDRQKFKMR